MPGRKIESDKNTLNGRVILIELQYFPPVSYFRQFLNAQTVIIESFETFQKQTFRNRCEIMTSNGLESLVVPVLKGSGPSMIKDLKIDYSQRWQQVHERSIRSAYGKAPFFEFFIEDFSRAWSQKPVFLWDLNMEILTLCLKMLRLKRDIHTTENYYTTEYYESLDIVDVRGQIQPNEYNEYRQNGMKQYHQIFGNDFAKDLSIIDLLFCAALDSSDILK